MFKQPKIRVDIFLEASDINIISRYARDHGFKNYSQAIAEIVLEWRRFQAIVNKLTESKHMEDLKNAEVVKEK